MIEVEVEDQGWVRALPDAQAVALTAAEAALLAPPLPCGEGVGGREHQTAGAGARTPISQPFGPQGWRGLSILLTSDEVVGGLNARFRDADRPTNVLSFPAPESARPHLGDIALAYGVCAREAAERCKPLAHHLTHLVAHGVLHLLGYDHEREEEAGQMEALERRILADLGVPDPYEAAA